MKTAKSLDCVEMKRAAQRMIRKQVKEMTPEEEIAFFRAGGKEFEKAIGEAKRLSGKKGPNSSKAKSRRE